MIAAAEELSTLSGICGAMVEVPKKLFGFLNEHAETIADFDSRCVGAFAAVDDVSSDENGGDDEDEAQDDGKVGKLKGGAEEVEEPPSKDRA